MNPGGRGCSEPISCHSTPAWKNFEEIMVEGRPAGVAGRGQAADPALACALCSRLLSFLLQMYACRADAFHRGICLFYCREPPCCAGLRVFRSQLPRKNDFYSYELPSENPSPETGQSVCLQLKSSAGLCRVCGCLGPKTCSRCHRAYYCSKEHQSLDQKLRYKQACTQSDHLDHIIPDHDFLFPEFAIVIEAKDEITPEVVEKEDYSEIIRSMGDALDEELDSTAKHESREDNIFQKFKTQIAFEPEQILRYGRGIAPIWISGENIPQEKDIPENILCDAKRMFEFQRWSDSIFKKAQFNYMLCIKDTP
uniref:MYND-type domain-containing protein n=1 Tax=Theropithecus gelada TaxID=9565 RepID=A0A8D2GAH8_THEGE